MIVWFFLAIGFMFLFQIGSVDFSKFHWPSALIVALPFLLFIGYATTVETKRRTSRG
jgi:hypothetical protein